MSYLIAAPKNRLEQKRLEKFMNTPPQQVTSRYARNLLVKGHNNDFYVLSMKRENCYVDGAWLANYYIIEVASGGVVKSAAGATPEQAITRCLGEKYGVTFR